LRRKAKYAAAIIAAIAAGIYVNNSTLLAARHEGNPILLAHRGIAQRFDEHDLKNDTCTAARMLPPTHDYLENTIRGIHAGFVAGADIVEIDVHPTTDGEFAVFHDWTLDCRTEGHGVTREHAMAELRQLDIGYGYTADGGQTFPFRGKGGGMMPSLSEVLTAFRDKRLLINVKSRDRSEGEKLAAVLNGLTSARRSLIMVYGGDEPIELIRRLAPDIRTISRASIKSCLLRYIGYGWTGMVPQACRSAMVLVPINAAPWLWGWPDRFLNRMKAANSMVFALGPYSGGEFLDGRRHTGPVREAARKLRRRDLDQRDRDHGQAGWQAELSAAQLRKPGASWPVRATYSV
jgi:glycerophosphoryl diester phosphodiesterase